jgi:hypothetical protein
MGAPLHHDPVSDEERLAHIIEAAKAALNARCFKAVPPLLEEAEKLKDQIDRRDSERGRAS